MKKELSPPVSNLFLAMWKNWVPNAMSMGNLSLGFLSILLASSSSGFRGHYSSSDIYFVAGFLILLAGLFDGLDGAIARFLRVESQMGEQLDSLADMTTFGLAPGVLMYAMYLHDIRMENSLFILPVGVIIATAHPLSAAFRLARFNVKKMETNTFTGLPSPMAGIMVAMMGLTYNSYTFNPLHAAAIFFCMAILMVSNVKYHKPQNTLRKYFTRFRLILFFVILGALMFYFGWREILFSILIFYISTGLFSLAIHFLQKVKVVLGKFNSRTSGVK